MQPNIHTLVKPTKRYKICVGRTLVDRTFKFNNTSAGFHLVINGLTKTLRWNLFPCKVIENVVGKFPNNNFAARKDNCFYFKLSYIGPFSITRQRRI